MGISDNEWKFCLFYLQHNSATCLQRLFVDQFLTNWSCDIFCTRREVSELLSCRTFERGRRIGSVQEKLQVVAAQTDSVISRVYFQYLYFLIFNFFHFLYFASFCILPIFVFLHFSYFASAQCKNIKISFACCFIPPLFFCFWSAFSTAHHQSFIVLFV